MAIKILYLILSGGKARRIGGKSKLLLDVGSGRQGNSMLVLDYVLRLIPSETVTDDAILLNCNDANDKAGLVSALHDRIGQDRINKAIPCITDMPEFMGQGPLAGMLAGLDYGRKHHFDAIITLPSDTPFMPKDIVTKLQEASNKGRKIVSAVSNGRTHPVVSIVPIHYYDSLYDYLANGNRKIQPFFEADDWRVIEFDEATADGTRYDPFININTEQDLEIARKIAVKLPL